LGKFILSEEKLASATYKQFVQLDTKKKMAQ
jgi:hypothetical protein